MWRDLQSMRRESEMGIASLEGSPGASPQRTRDFAARGS